jgi:hypothetical protein
LADPGAAAGPRWPLPRGLIVLLGMTEADDKDEREQDRSEDGGELLQRQDRGFYPLTGILRRRRAPLWLAMTVTAQFTQLTNEYG